MQGCGSQVRDVYNGQFGAERATVAVQSFLRWMTFLPKNRGCQVRKEAVVTESWRKQVIGGWLWTERVKWAQIGPNLGLGSGPNHKQQKKIKKRKKISKRNTKNTRYVIN